MALILADVYLPGGRNVRRNTTPGRSVQFSGGRCQIVDHRDMQHVFSWEDARVYPHPEAMAWAPEWLRNTPWIKAEVNWPEGWTVEHLNAQEFVVYFTEAEPYQASAQPTQTEPVSVVDVTDRQEWKKITPDDLLEESDKPAEPQRSRRRG